jgi:uncharacterized repeat protein (TIGR01451 family)
MSAQLNVSTVAIGAGTWWSNGLTGGIWDVGVVDSGIDINHTDFASPTHVSGRFLATAEGMGWDPSNDPTSDDVNGHGTNVAGITSSGSSVYRGVAYGHDKLFNLKAGYDGDGADGGSAYMYWSDAMAAVDWALEQLDAPDVLNLSYGGCATTDDHGFNRFWDAVVDDLDTSVAVSAGNSGTECIHYPSTAYNVVSVANVIDYNTTTRSDDTIYPSSSRGPVPISGRRKPDLAAPGTGIMAANNTWEVGLDWVAYTGTSQAAPHVAGALLLALDRGFHSPRAQKALLINTAEDRDDPGWDASWGWGYLDLTHAYDHGLNDVHQYSVDAAPDYDLFVGALAAGDTATLVWNRHVDYAGAAYPPPESVHDLNDLDLYLYDVYNNRQVDQSISAIDNVEQVQADASMTGVLRVQAFSADLNGVDSEPYALATEGDFSPVTGPVLETSGGGAYFMEPGESVTFTLTVTNGGGLTLHAVEVTLEIPDGVLLIDGVNPVAMGNLFPDSSQSATWVFQKVTDQVVRTITIGTEGEGYGLSFSSEDLLRLVKPPGFFIPLVMRNWSQP